MEQFAKRMRTDIEIVKQKQSCVISLAQYISKLVYIVWEVRDGIESKDPSIAFLSIYY